MEKKKNVWEHLNYDDADIFQTLTKKFKLDIEVAEALTDRHTRPRYFTHKKGIVFILKGVSIINFGGEKDIASIRIWLDKDKIITLANRPIKALDDAKERIKKSKKMPSPVECFLEITDCLADDIYNAAYKITEKADSLEAEVIKLNSFKDSSLRMMIGSLRRKIISLRRHIAPHHDIYVNIKLEKIPLLTEADRAELREIYHKMTKAVEDLDYAHNHLAISVEELQGQVNIRISRIMYIISIVTVIFMPMGLLTSLLGINVAGIPFAEEPHAFAWISLGLLFICMGLIFVLKKIRWI